MSGEPKDGLKFKQVSQAEFVQNTEAIVRRSETEPVILTDGNGAPRTVVYCPRQKLP